MMTLNEFDLINKIKQSYYRESSLLKGIGDDAAVFKQANESIVTAVDTFVENIHFIKDKTVSMKELGYRCLAATISDLTAMGALPKFYLVSIVIPKHWQESDILDVFSGLDQLAKEYKMDLIGGDTVSGDTFVLSITVNGYADEKKIRYRSDAKVDDIVFVTGTLGDSGAGLDILLGELKIENEKFYINRHRKPEPRVTFIQALKEIDRLCLNDISDGISSELNEIAKASKISIIIDDELVPVSKELNNLAKELLFKFKYTSGEDFELVGTTSEKNWITVKEIAEKMGIKVTKIGEVVESSNSEVFLNSYNQILKSNGYIHLK